MKTSRIITIMAIALSLTFATYAKDTQSCTRADKAACCKSEKCCTDCCSKADCCDHSAISRNCATAAGEKSCSKKSCDHKS